jgi:hypothetical protein
MKLLLYTFFIAVAVPFFTFSMDAKNPKDACERFLNETEKKACEEKATSKDIDWYASSLCEKIDNDKLFLSCFDSIQRAHFDPKALEHCEAISADEDGSRMKCLELVKNKVLGDCSTKKDLTTLESCLKTTNARLPSSERKFFQK